MLDLLHSNPWRPVDSWWERAARLVNDPSSDSKVPREPWASVRRDSGRGCASIKQAQRFLIAIAGAKSKQEQMAVMREYPAIYWAKYLHEQSDPGNQRVRWTVEARILARLTDEEIGQTTGCQPQYVAAYEALFFNVRDRLHRRDFILGSVIGPPVTHGSKPPDEGYVWKLFGYLGGPHMLDAIISPIPNAAWARSAEDVPSFLRDAAVNAVNVKAAIAALTMPVSARTHKQLINSFVKFVKMTPPPDSADSTQSRIHENLQSMLASLPFASGGTENVNDLADYDCGAAEDELLLADFGPRTSGIDDRRDRVALHS